MSHRVAEIVVGCGVLAVAIASFSIAAGLNMTAGNGSAARTAQSIDKGTARLVAAAASKSEARLAGAPATKPARRTARSGDTTRAGTDIGAHGGGEGLTGSPAKTRAMPARTAFAPGPVDVVALDGDLSHKSATFSAKVASLSPTTGGPVVAADKAPPKGAPEPGESTGGGAESGVIASAATVAPALPGRDLGVHAECVEAPRSKACLHRMIGQMIMVGFLGRTARARGVHAAKRQIRRGTIGGVALFAANISSPGQIAALNRQFQKSAKAGGNPPIFIGVDQEGGRVQRLSSANGKSWGFPFPALRVARSCTPGQARKLYDRAMACHLRKAGINVSFGPVVDTHFSANPIIGRLRRSFGGGVRRITNYARAFIIAHKENGILVTAKHFPGHGSSRKDTHKDFTSVARTWKASELAPYRDLSGMADMVMVGHIYHPRFSNGQAPATLSKRAIEGILRGQLHFKGLAITDDMRMGAIRKHYRFEDSLIRAVKAGNDILLLSTIASDRNRIGPRINAILSKAVRDGRLTRARITQSYRRILRAKRLLQHAPAAAPRTCMPARRAIRTFCRK